MFRMNGIPRVQEYKSGDAQVHSLGRMTRELQVMWEEFGKAFCLMLILEGIMPFLYPNRWRKLVATLATISDRDIRIVGLVSMLAGLAVLLFLTH